MVEGIMTTMAMTRPRFPFGFLLMLALTTIVGAFFVASLAHATNKHPEDQDAIRKCLASGGASWVGWNAKLNRFAFVCKTESGYGFRALGIDKATGGWYQATSFIPDGAATQSDVIQYLNDTGYCRFNGPIGGFTGSPASIYASLLESGIIIP